MSDGMNDEWHKALVLVMCKLGILEILITKADMDEAQAIAPDQQPAALVFQKEDGIHIKIMSQKEAREMEELSRSKPS